MEAFGRKQMGLSKKNIEEQVEALRKACAAGEWEDDDKKVFNFEMDLFLSFLDGYIDGKPVEEVITKAEPLKSLATYVPRNVEPAEGKLTLSKLALVKLNGGMGSRMGCKYSKSSIEIGSGKSMLDVAVEHVGKMNSKYGTSLGLYLMSSFYTHEETQKILTKYKDVGFPIESFLQHRLPRIRRDGNLAPADPSASAAAWSPTGSADVFQCLISSGIAQRLLDSGVEAIFVSDVDNLGATMDPALAADFLASPHDVLMEVVDRRQTDKTSSGVVSIGGTLRYVEFSSFTNSKEVAEIARQSGNVWCNSCWFKLKALVELEGSGKLAKAEVTPTIADARGHGPCLQLERLLGVTLALFDNRGTVRVPQSRLLKIKTTEDLFLAQSNLYENHDGVLQVSPKRQYPTLPLVKFGSHHHHIGHYNARFGNLPDILELDHLTISGDVSMGKGCVLKGTVIIIAEPGEKIFIPPGTILENKIVSGSLRLLDH
mmetsp:Transcript_34515/g.97355  ORF Transcript_34515/g.97355 Transcript_34515/m.97355 type:complete len:486 (-) Transcript_34515:221-1678(-)|eukprot:CAMPEP_0119152746 /NCGR_PEP_ID=MMETSP1310-20130426/48248_1 /TAXON_ID=464262 /ORGANISM="Genus nov. species nov., Strain RCC2339" /LENGTH=485 /DNA_ID=CAMNT_0007145145 /DNA_START=103 /DNA_END=1560 /DNA_ORIENTATION=+